MAAWEAVGEGIVTVTTTTVALLLPLRSQHLVEEGERLVPETDDAGFTAVELDVVAAPEDKAVNASTAVVSNSKLEPVSP